MDEQKRVYWSKLIGEQEASGQTIRVFCEQRGIADNSFYRWRQRLQNSEPVQFALLKTGGSQVPLELCLTNGARLRIGSGVDPATLPGAGGTAVMMHLPASVRVYPMQRIEELLPHNWKTLATAPQA